MPAIGKPFLLRRPMARLIWASVQITRARHITRFPAQSKLFGQLIKPIFRGFFSIAASIYELDQRRQFGAPIHCYFAIRHR